jgi:hypothetical protein
VADYMKISILPSLRFHLQRMHLRALKTEANDAPKVFCIGLNKTGTTSLEIALKNLGYKMGNQYHGEMLLKDYARRNFKPIIQFCSTADAFQDAPFSFPFTFYFLDQAFPNAKFLLTVRDDADQWYNSLVNFHAKIFGGGKVPTKEVLQNAYYRYKGRPWEASRVLFNTPEYDVYHKPTLISYYERHNADVREYFRLKQNFLEINLSEPGAYLKMCAFLGKEPIDNDFPWLNKT